MSEKKKHRIRKGDIIKQWITLNCSKKAVFHTASRHHFLSVLCFMFLRCNHKFCRNKFLHNFFFPSCREMFLPPPRFLEIQITAIFSVWQISSEIKAEACFVNCFFAGQVELRKELEFKLAFVGICRLRMPVCLGYF